MKQNYSVISAYLFTALSELPLLREQLLDECSQLGLKGTILLAEEGINLTLAGTEMAITTIQAYLSQVAGLSALEYKLSPANILPFGQLLVKIKPEIISLDRPQFDPAPFEQTHLPAVTFKQWLDEKRDVLVLDTRNRYETASGHFENAYLLPIDSFRDFPTQVAQLDPSFKQKPIVMYCTGGVRCEKAAAVMVEQGFSEIYQLDGGILKYFEECGGAHYKGECFVFDERIGLTPELKESQAILCEKCQYPVTLAEQQVAGACLHCADTL